MKILNYNLKGGCGKSTATVNAACLAQHKNIKTLIIDGDLQHNTSSFLSVLAKTDYVRGRGFKYGSVEVTRDETRINDEIDLMIIDAPPALNYVSNVAKDVDVILIPIDGIWAADGSITVISEAKQKAPGARAIIWYNKAADSKFSRQERKQLAEELTMVELFRLPIPASENFERSAMLNVPVWEVPYSSRSYAVQNFRLLCEFIINGCPSNQTYKEDEEREEFSLVTFRKPGRPKIYG